MDRVRILLVDDDELVAKAMARTLLRGADVDHESRIESALERIASDPNYDLILCDLYLGAARGTELYQIVLERLPSYSSRIAFMSGFGETPRELETLREVSCLGKPVPVEAVIALARQGRSRVHGS